MRQSDDDVNPVYLRASGKLFATIQKTEIKKPKIILIGSFVVP